MVRPLGLFVLAEVAAECFLAPGAVARVGDWGVRGDGSVFAGVFEELMGRRWDSGQRCDCDCDARSDLSYVRGDEWKVGGGKRKRAHQSQSAVSAHAVSEDTDAVRIHLFEVVEDGPEQFRVDVAVHFIPFVPWGFGRVDVEPGAAAEIVGVVFTLDL